VLKRVTKVSVEQRVDERVERRVDVTDPEQNGDDDRRCFGTEFSAQSVVDVPCEERQPAAEERAHDDAERLGRLVLAPHLSTFWSLSVRQLRTVWSSSALRRRRHAAVAGCSQVETVDRRSNRHRQRLNELGLSLSGAENTKIGDDHDDRWKPERDSA